MALPARIVRHCRSRLFRSKAADSSGANLAGGQFLLRTLVLCRLLRREVLRPAERFGWRKGGVAFTA